MKKGNYLLLLLTGAIVLNNTHIQAESQSPTKPKISWIQQKRANIKKMWLCLCSQKDCTNKEVARAKRWCVKTPTKIIVTTLAAIGVAVTTYYVTKQQQTIANENEDLKQEGERNPQYTNINRQQRLALRSASEGISRKVELTCKNVIDILNYSFTKIEDALAAFKQQYGTEPAKKLKNFIENCKNRNWYNP